jgi:hypothetical protein
MCEIKLFIQVPEMCAEQWRVFPAPAEQVLLFIVLKQYIHQLH